MARKPCGGKASNQSRIKYPINSKNPKVDSNNFTEIGQKHILEGEKEIMEQLVDATQNILL